MKKIINLTCLFTLISMFFITCKKDTSIVTVVPFTRIQLLTNKVWQVDEVQRSINGVNSSYLSGGTNSTGVSYSNIRIKFNIDHTGTYTDDNSVQTVVQWVFSSSDERNAQVTIGISPNSVTYIWNMIELKDNYLHCVTPYNSNSLYAVRYIQVP